MLLLLLSEWRTLYISYCSAHTNYVSNDRNLKRKKYAVKIGLFIIITQSSNFLFEKGNVGIPIKCKSFHFTRSTPSVVFFVSRMIIQNLGFWLLGYLLAIQLKQI